MSAKAVRTRVFATRYGDADIEDYLSLDDFPADSRIVILPAADFDRMVELVETLSGQPCWCSPDDDGYVCGVCRARAFLAGETKETSNGK